MLIGSLNPAGSLKAEGRRHLCRDCETAEVQSPVDGAHFRPLFLLTEARRHRDEEARRWAQAAG